METLNDRAVAVIYKDDKLLMMWHYDKGQEFYGFVGGTQEEGEDIEDTLVRETFEETNLVVKEFKKIYEYDHKYQLEINGEMRDFRRHEHYFFISNFTGDIKMGFEELSRQNKERVYRLDWLDLEKAYKIDYDPDIIWEIINKNILKLNILSHNLRKK